MVATSPINKAAGLLASMALVPRTRSWIGPITAVFAFAAVEPYGLMAIWFSLSILSWLLLGGQHSCPQNKAANCLMVGPGSDSHVW